METRKALACHHLDTCYIVVTCMGGVCCTSAVYDFFRDIDLAKGVGGGNEDHLIHKADRVPTLMEA